MTQTTTPVDSGGHAFDAQKHATNADGTPKLRPSDGTFVIRGPGRTPSAAALRFFVTLAIGSEPHEVWASFAELGDARHFAKAKRYDLTGTTSRVYAGHPGRSGQIVEELLPTDWKDPRSRK